MIKQIQLIAEQKGPKCWNRIGVYGDSTCDILDRYDHCKNCPVYAEGGRKLFKREIPEDLIAEWTEQFSLPKEIDSETTESLIVFRISDEWLAVRTICFIEAVDNKFVHYVPSRSNDYLLGLVNVNGELLMCISLSSFLNLPGVAPDYESKSKVYKSLLVMERTGESYVFPVDENLGVIKIDTSMYKDAAATITKSSVTLTNYTFDISDKTVSIIDENRLFEIINAKLRW